VPKKLFDDRDTILRFLWFVIKLMQRCTFKSWYVLNHDEEFLKLIKGTEFIYSLLRVDACGYFNLAFWSMQIQKNIWKKYLLGFKCK
jgi:hypothetical protein